MATPNKVEIEEKTFWIDFNGWFSIKAKDSVEASDKAGDLIAEKLGCIENFHFDIDCVEEDEPE